MAKVLMVGLRRRRGEKFKVRSNVARVLEAVGAAARVVREAPEQKASPSPANAPAASADDELAVMRAEYKVLFGRAPYSTWNAAELAQRIAAKKAPG